MNMKKEYNVVFGLFHSIIHLNYVYLNPTRHGIEEKLVSGRDRNSSMKTLKKHGHYTSLTVCFRVTLS